MPGTRVLRRHDGRVQVGLDPRHAVLLPAGSDAALARLADGGPLDPLLHPLLDAGLLVARRTVSALVNSVDESLKPAAAALVRVHGADAPTAWAARSRAEVRVVAYGAAGDGLAARAAELLTEAGLSARTDVVGPPSRDGPALLVGTGQPDRELVDDWMRGDVPHLVVRMCEGQALVGPFVDPGRSACLRCVDAHHTDVDPTWPLLVRQHAAAGRRGRSEPADATAPEPVDPLLATLAPPRPARPDQLGRGCAAVAAVEHAYARRGARRRRGAHLDPTSGLRLQLAGAHRLSRDRPRRAAAGTGRFRTYLTSHQG